MKLDLTTLAKKTLDITLLDGAEISINKPSKEFIIEMESFKSKGSGLTTEKVFDLMEDMALKILNNNTAGVKYDKKYLADTKVDYTVQTIIFNKYLEFVEDVMYNPN